MNPYIFVTVSDEDLRKMRNLERGVNKEKGKEKEKGKGKGKDRGKGKGKFKCKFKGKLELISREFLCCFRRNKLSFRNLCNIFSSLKRSKSGELRSKS